MDYGMMNATCSAIDAFFTEHIIILHQEVGDEMLDAKQG
jgi:hypothetical protein